MRNTLRIDGAMVRRTVFTLAAMAVVTSTAACSHAMMMMRGTGATRPAAGEFGLGPRTSADGRYVATLDVAPEDEVPDIVAKAESMFTHFFHERRHPIASQS